MEYLIVAVLLVIAAQTTYLWYQSFERSKVGKSEDGIFVDTSVLIDGRIVAVAQSGFVSGTLLIPRSVIAELQLLADTADADKRSRARHGLDVVTILQEMPNVTVRIFQDGAIARDGVDDRLLELCKKYKARLCTIDYNLNKVAVVEGIQVLNVNDLAMSLRMAYLPGEKVMLELTSKGNDGHQAVGHLADGTMVVVEKASAFIGTTQEVEFIRSLQTAAGKMMFARLTKKQKPAKDKESLMKRVAQKPAPKIQAKPMQKTPQKPQEARLTRPQQQRRKRPQTNEERLVELANQ